jgi:DNA-binding transcriptional ArsR family regulator
MGLTKTELFTAADNEMATIAKALAHPARVAIIRRLLEVNACVNGELVEEFGLAQATISQHLRELKSVGIIQGSIEGTRISYCIDPRKWKEIRSAFEELFGSYRGGLEEDCC